MSTQPGDIIGRRFGALVVMKLDSIATAKNRQASYMCKCDCGNDSIVRKWSLTSGGTLSCGCYSRELASRRLISMRSSGIKGRCVLCGSDFPRASLVQKRCTSCALKLKYQKKRTLAPSAYKRTSAAYKSGKLPPWCR